MTQIFCLHYVQPNPPVPGGPGAHLGLGVGSGRSAEDLVVVHHPLHAPQQGEGRVGGVDGVQGPRRRRLWREKTAER